MLFRSSVEAATRCGAPPMALPMPHGVRLRDANPADADALHALYHAAYAPDEDPFRRKPIRDTRDDVRSYLSERAVLVAEDPQGALVATAHLRAIANLRRVAVHPERKGEGLGAAMVKAAVARARAERFDFVELDTQHDHPWLPGFYRRHGFVERGVETMADGSRWLVMRQRLWSGARSDAPRGI